jgi:hypothetical protein
MSSDRVIDIRVSVSVCVMERVPELAPTGLMAEILAAIQPGRYTALADLVRRFGTGVENACIQLWQMKLLSYQTATDGALPPEFVTLPMNLLQYYRIAPPQSVESFFDTAVHDDQIEAERNAGMWGRGRRVQRSTMDETGVAPLPGMNKASKDLTRRLRQKIKATRPKNKTVHKFT